MRAISCNGAMVLAMTLGVLASRSAWAQGFDFGASEEEAVAPEAQEEAPPPPPKEIRAAPAAQPEPEEAPVAKAEAQGPMLAVVRGLYVEARFGGGYTLAQGELEATSQFPLIGGQSEGYGAAVLGQVAIGYDVAEFLAIEVVGGQAFLSGTRRERVRDLGIYYGGGAVRLSLGFSERLRFVGAAGGGYGVATTGIDPSDQGPVILGNLALEYYVHIRHFSVGLGVTGVVPLNPLRVVLGVAPQLKYTF